MNNLTESFEYLLDCYSDAVVNFSINSAKNNETDHYLRLLNKRKKALIDCYDNLRAEPARKDEIIALLKDDAERLAKHYMCSDLSSDIKYCVHCGIEADYDLVLDEYVVNHRATCPITLHHSIIEGLEEK